MVSTEYYCESDYRLRLIILHVYEEGWKRHVQIWFMAFYRCIERLFYRCGCGCWLTFASSQRYMGMQVVTSHNLVNLCHLCMNYKEGNLLLLSKVNRHLRSITNLAKRESLLQVQRLLDPFKGKLIYHYQSLLQWSFTKCKVITISVFIFCSSTFTLMNLQTISQFSSRASNPKSSGDLCWRLEG